VKVHDAVVRAEQGDIVERVWREQGQKLWRSLAAFTGDPDLASDAMAEAFAQALGRGEAVEVPERWIWRAAFRIASGELKIRSQNRPELLLDATALPEPVIDLVRALKTLSPQQRGAVILHLYADLPAREVARILGCSQATVRVHISQARRRLRPLLEGHDD
jgi:RNA polymerase sigma-70 factor (ECF subfamily)